MAKPRYGLADRYHVRKYKLPRGRAYSVSDHDVVVADGTTLKVSHYAPAGSPRGTVVAMSPYGRTGFTPRMSFGPYAAQGYHVLAVSVRGSCGSGGSFNPMLDEPSDFRDVVGWMRNQPWYTGSFASVGASYLGWTQWALLMEPQPDHKAAIVVVGPHEFRDFHWGSGTFTSAFPMWLALLEAQESQLRSFRYLLTKGKPVYRMLRKTPVADVMFQAVPGQKAWAEDRIMYEADDPFWEPVDLSEALERANIPVLICTGWQDLFIAQSIEQFTRLRARGVDSALTVGPGDHSQAATSTASAREPFEWLETHLVGTGPARASRVHLHVTGADEWRDLDEWPPATVVRRMHLAAGALVDTAVTGEQVFVFDPEDPPTFPGGPLLIGGGYADDTDVAARGDVLSYASAVLTADVEVHGSPVVVLDRSSQHLDANLFVRISDVDERGRSRNVAQGDVRVHSDGTVHIQLTPIAHRFRAGHRIRLTVAGGAYPHFLSSPGTGENPMFATQRVPNRHTIQLAGSYLELPVMPSLSNVN
ncbi:hydrolase, CocE/NonD family [Nocardia nova SH22a]|uniref:Hydrolase, CocE/NonD family n=1 Tax=Nocardia nova SH22a TaxID=1415166 RepID=W5TM55_9NOCA|nr:CocE/NonD family hydrolase [Nocardia nova]AHH20068.1 hydrolase, CocE/NonD family [Nocardia nova SH22a]